MSKRSALPCIRLRGVRQHNLKNLDLDLPLGRLIVVTGLSGSGKSSLAFDTLFAEGQRRYIETFSPYARQFFDRMDKPAADHIEGIPPAIAIEQRNTVKTTRSTVGTMTEICDYMKSLWSHLARLHCRGCGAVVRKESPQDVWQAVSAVASPEAECLITFDLPLSEKLSLDESLALIARQGYQRLLLEGEVVRLSDLQTGGRSLPSGLRSLTVIQDRLKLRPTHRARFIEACEQAYHFGHGRLTVWEVVATDAGARVGPPRRFSNRFHCAHCDIEYRDPSPALFSFNHPLGACPKCRGFGRIISIDYRLAVPDRTLTLAEGVVRPWRSGFSAECQDDLMRFCRARGVPVDVPFCELPPQVQDWVINGDPDYGSDAAHQWPHAWYGVKGYFRWLESKAYKMHVRVLLSRYRAYEPCPDCHGDRLQPEALLYRIPLEAADAPAAAHSSADGPSASALRNSSLSLADFYRQPIRDAAALIDRLAEQHRLAPGDPLGVVLDEVRSRLHYLVEIGLGYLTLDRPTRTLSGGETERVNLTTCLGTRLVNTLFVLDEPSVGLHPRDTARLVRVLEKLRDAGNTVVVVEHEAGVIRAADQIIDLGPGHGESGGHLVFQGSLTALKKCRHSLTGQYLSGRRRIEAPARRPVTASDPPRLRLQHATRHNLRDLAVEIPLRRLVCVTGVSGSGKTTLVREVLLPALESRLRSPTATVEPAGRSIDSPSADDDLPATPLADASLTLEGWEHIRRVVLVDQSPLGKTPRSNPAVYTGAFDHIREFFAASEPARQRGLNASAFSFNSVQGQCATCRGAGFEKVEMQFLSDVFIRCPECQGRRYRPHILEVTIPRPNAGLASPATAIRRSRPPTRSRSEASAASIIGESESSSAWSIADLLDATVDEAVEFLESVGDSKPARRAAAHLRILQDVGLGYLRVGQPINTLSGGESQRLKLAAHLAAAMTSPGPQAVLQSTPEAELTTLFLFDEPTTGLHFDDVRVLLQVFQRLVDAGNSVVVIEHNLDVIRCADWILDLGPEAGEDGGRLVAVGTPEDIAACPTSHTGRALRMDRPGAMP